jgi:hypothetical protein
MSSLAFLAGSNFVWFSSFQALTSRIALIFDVNIRAVALSLTSFLRPFFFDSYHPEDREALLKLRVCPLAGGYVTAVTANEY